jgi:hypothetical protein
MKVPGFTAETSLYRSWERYRTSRSGEHNSGGIYPAQWLATRLPRDLTDFQEPQCWRICLGGYCRWICF